MVDLGNDDPLGFVDDRDRQGSLSGFGLEVTGTERRESRLDVEKASVFGVDDRSSASRGSSKNSKKSTQKGLGGFGGDLLDEDEAWF